MYQCGSKLCLVCCLALAESDSLLCVVCCVEDQKRTSAITNKLFFCQKKSFRAAIWYYDDNHR